MSSRDYTILVLLIITFYSLQYLEFMHKNHMQKLERHATSKI